MKTWLLTGLIFVLFNNYCFAHQNIIDIDGNDNVNENPYSLMLQVLDEKLKTPIPNAKVLINKRVITTNRKGRAYFQRLPNTISPTIIYQSISLIKATTFHQLTINNKSKITLPIISATDRKIRAQFSLMIPFGQLPTGTEYVSLVPNLQHLFSDFKKGDFRDILAFDDNLQEDGKLTLLVTAFDTDGHPIKYGYMLDQSPSVIDQRFITLTKPHFSPIENNVNSIHWQKTSDRISRSNANTNCDYSNPPYTICGTFRQETGLFSWVSVNHKGITIPTPGAFLPARTQGSNPYLPLPNSVYELIGHDEPLGPFPMNFTRNSYQHFNYQSKEMIDITMPDLLIGRMNQNGNEAIQYTTTGEIPVLQWSIYAENSPLPELGIATIIWKNRETKTSVHWQHIFEPKPGLNKIYLDDIKNDMFREIKSTEPVDITISLYGSNKFDNYQDVINVYMTGNSPINVGSKRFSVSRWR